MQGEVSSGGGEEKILVLVRLRPLSEKEVAQNEVADWECINENTILYRNILQEQSVFPTAYTFDGVFGGDSQTRHVYEEGAKEIVLSVVSGINSSIFAYGQTSSGKTYTMDGITEFAVADIYDYVHRHEERAFVLKFCAMEIYNEAIRDLLSKDSTPLRVLDDPEKGTVVEKLTEETLRGWTHFKELLSICEAQRRIGETSLNVTSSRSHQILRLTIESSAREFLGKDNSTKLSASVNFVDLAGSERSAQASSVGTRLKEGSHINRSLLTLSTVIRKLSKGRHGHVNYRDSKLTRILQPCLGGNARTAIICTLSPARSHVEQSRNTLSFATCAKEVRTNAKVNVVMSDKALVKRLQKELARLESELRTPAPSSTSDYASLLRKKDLQIEKLEKELREQTKQRELAESRVQDLLLMAGNDEASMESGGLSNHPKWQEGNKWEDECSASESSVTADTHYKDIGGRKMDNSWPSRMDSFSNPLSDRGTAEDPNEICEEVRCIEMDESGADKICESIALSTANAEGMLINVVNDELKSTPPREVTESQSSTTDGIMEEKQQDVRSTNDSLVSPYPEATSPWAQGNMSWSENQKVNRSWSYRPNMAGSFFPEFETTGDSQNTPVEGFERSFPGRPQGFSQRTRDLASLMRCDSQSSTGSASVDELKAQKNENSPYEDIPSIDTFVAGLKEMAKVDYEKQLGNCKGEEQTAEKNVKDVGLDPTLDTAEATAAWNIEFEIKQKAILELWQSCNISLVYRTYFFLLFRGDSRDAVYMEVEMRRLSFLKEAFSQGNHAWQGGQILTLASSLKALQREREMLCQLMQERLSEAERKGLYQMWGISLGSKRRRFQLVSRLWSDANDIYHAAQSASIVGKLIRFRVQGEAPKQMFGLSFPPAPTIPTSLKYSNFHPQTYHMARGVR